MLEEIVLDKSVFPGTESELIHSISKLCRNHSRVYEELKGARRSSSCLESSALFAAKMIVGMRRLRIYKGCEHPGLEQAWPSDRKINLIIAEAFENLNLIACNGKSGETANDNHICLTASLLQFFLKPESLRAARNLGKASVFAHKVSNLETTLLDYCLNLLKDYQPTNLCPPWERQIVDLGSFHGNCFVQAKINKKIKKIIVSSCQLELWMLSGRLHEYDAVFITPNFNINNLNLSIVTGIRSFLRSRQRSDNDIEIIDFISYGEAFSFMARGSLQHKNYEDYINRGRIQAEIDNIYQKTGVLSRCSIPISTSCLWFKEDEAITSTVWGHSLFIRKGERPHRIQISHKLAGIGPAYDLDPRLLNLNHIVHPKEIHPKLNKKSIDEYVEIGLLN